MDGGRGDDHLDAEGGNDRVLGRGGDDLIGSWGSDADHIHAGPGRDTVYDSLVLSADQAVDAGPGRDEVMVSSDYEVDGRRVRPRTVIDLAAGTAPCTSTSSSVTACASSQTIAASVWRLAASA